MASIIIENVDNQLHEIIRGKFVIPRGGSVSPTRYFCTERTFWKDYYEDEEDKIKKLVHQGKLKIIIEGSPLTPQEADERKVQQGRLRVFGGRNNYDSATNPTANDDDNEGYTPGSIWINSSQYHVFICADSTPGSAMWIQLD